MQSIGTPQATSRRTDEMLACNVGISLGPQYTQTELSDMIAAVRKVDANLLGEVNG